MMIHGKLAMSVGSNISPWSEMSYCHMCLGVCVGLENIMDHNMVLLRGCRYLP
jgi:hypothetical protein